MHASPAGSPATTSPAARLLVERAGFTIQIRQRHGTAYDPLGYQRFGGATTTVVGTLPLLLVLFVLLARWACDARSAITREQADRDG